MWFPALGTLFRFTDDDVITVGTGDRSANQKNVLRFANLNDLEILAGTLDLTHMTRHAHSAHNRAGEQALTNRAGAAVPTLCAVRRIAASERMSPDNTFKPTTFGNADGVDV